MKIISRLAYTISAALGVSLSSGVLAADLSNAQKGEQLYKKHCASCHDIGVDKAPKVEDLKRLSQSQIMMTISIGRMQPQAAAMSKDERSWVSEYLSGGGEVDNTWLEANRCDKYPVLTEADSKVISADWGFGEFNNRLQTQSEITPENVHKLKLKWAFGFQKVNDMRNQPVYTDDALYVGSKSAHVMALDPETGCIKWQQQTAAGVRSSLVLGEIAGERVLFFADELANVYALRAKDGSQVWKENLGVFPTSLITGTPSFYKGKVKGQKDEVSQLIVPISSFEVAAAGMPGYPCCRSHGMVIALDANTGKTQWQWHATEQAKPLGKTKSGVPMFGPSGAVVWTTPTIDAERGLIFIGTGENTSKPATDTSDSVVALEMATGKMRWKFQALANDIWNAACLNGGEACPEDMGPDFDFGAPMILHKMSDGRPVLLAGQKSSEVFALNPDTGKLYWRNRLSMGTTNGGIHWGMTVYENSVYVPLADPERDIPGYTPKPGLYRLNIDNGKVEWAKPVSRGCDFDMEYAPKIGLEQVRSGKKRKLEDRYACSWYYGLSAAPSAVPGLVFAAGLDGKLSAYRMKDGEILWQSKTAVPFKTVNGLAAHGGAIDVDGAVLGKDKLFINSGYSMFGQLPGNVLLAFELEK